MNALSREATYSQDEAFPFRDRLRDLRPRDREDLEDPKELDRSDLVRVWFDALCDRMCCVGKGVLQSLEI